MSVNLIQEHSTLDGLLEHWREALAGDFPAYYGHVFRVFNMGRTLLGAEPELEEPLAVACVFHDLGIWTHNTFDYLTPSESLAIDYLHDRGRPEWIQPVTLAIDLHHRLRPWRGEQAVLVEALRRADLADLSFGWLTGGIDRDLARETRRTFPNAGFHRRLMRLSLHWGVRHPLRPFPMMKF